MAVWPLLLLQLIPAQPLEPASNFAVRFDHKGCHYEYLDTFKGTYSHVGATAPVSFSLTPAQQRILFRAILGSGFFDLPSRRFGEAVNPADIYELEVRNGLQRNRVSWSVDWAYHTDKGLPIWELHKTIFALLERHPDVQRLPKRGDGCNRGAPVVR